MPCNALDILDMCPAQAGDFRGLYVLFKEKSSTQLRFVGYDSTADNPTIIPAEQKAPEGACKLASLLGEDGMTDLLVSGSKLSYWRASDFHGGETAPFTVSDSAIAELSQFHVVQEGDKLSTWSLTKENSLSYQEFTFSSKKATIAHHSSHSSAR
jgi:hypothetical protein